MLKPKQNKTTIDKLREAIWMGQFRQGQPLRGAGLSKQFKVSHTTLRELFRTLEKEYIIEQVPNAGVKVTTLTEHKIEEVYSFRDLLEPYAIGCAMENLIYTKKDFLNFERILDQLDTAQKNNDWLESAKLDFEFHFEICKPCGNELLMDCYKNFQSLTILCHISPVPPSIIVENNPKKDHPKILSAIRSGDILMAQETLRAHLRSAKNLLITQMQIQNK